MVLEIIIKEMSFFNKYSRTLANVFLPVEAKAIIKFSLSILLLSNCINDFSQNTVQLHPVVGDTISYSEKVAFYLFPEINDSSFIEGIVFFQDSAFKVKITEKYKDSYILSLDSTLLKKYNNNIEKLIHYYSTLEVADSVEQKQLLLSNTSTIQLSPEFILNEEERKQLVKESRRYLRKKDKAEDLGLWGVDKDNYIKGASNSNIFKAKIRFK